MVNVWQIYTRGNIGCSVSFTFLLISLDFRLLPILWYFMQLNNVNTKYYWTGPV